MSPSRRGFWALTMWRLSVSKYGKKAQDLPLKILRADFCLRPTSKNFLIALFNLTSILFWDINWPQLRSIQTYSPFRIPDCSSRFLVHLSRPSAFFYCLKLWWETYTADIPWTVESLGATLSQSASNVGVISISDLFFYLLAHRCGQSLDITIRGPA